ncbi:hypothetical protein BRADI_4g29400v3 [Brachypodium distachyon]|uniref:PWI domain-containing protein n=1 Tax=Brachypodium distachyon TaxID=15368 RepID=A0A0Q3EUY9_BRADI|nr:hypothetical protein BRADI_4g29400v3 [Brachypodium distachyon]
MSRPRAAAAQSSAASAATVLKPPADAPVRTPNSNPIPTPFASHFRPLGLGALPPAPYPAPFYYMGRPPLFPPVMPPGAFPGPSMYPPLPPPPGGFVPHPGIPSPQFGRPPSLPVAPASEPHFIVYVGNIASTVCGLVKSWKRVSNPCGGTPIKLGFCEFGSGEDSLRAKRFLNKLSVDGQELVVNVNAATKEYLEKYGENATEEKVEEAEMQKIRCMVEERRRTKLPGSPTSPVQTSASIGDADGDGNIRGSALEERKVRRRCEKEEHLGEMKAPGSQGWEGREVTAAVKSSLQIDAASSMDVAKKHNTVNDERKSQHNAIFASLEGDGFHKSNDEEKGTVSVPALVSDKQNNSAPGEKVGFELQSTSKSVDKKTLDAEQLLATVPKTKEELFAYVINWEIYDKHGLHAKIMPWASKKGSQYLAIKEHVDAAAILEPLAGHLEDDTEKFFLSLWRKLIFEIKKVETGLA